MGWFSATAPELSTFEYSISQEIWRRRRSAGLRPAATECTQKALNYPMTAECERCCGIRLKNKTRSGWTDLVSWT